LLRFVWLLLFLLLIPAFALTDTTSTPLVRRSPSPMTRTYKVSVLQDPTAGIVIFEFKGSRGNIFINEQQMCRNQNRCIGEIPAGEYTVALRQEGYLDSLFTIQVPSGTNYYPTALREKPGVLALLTLDAETKQPVVGTVYLDDKEMGPTPWTGPVPPETKTITVRAPRHLETTVSERPPKRSQISATIAMPITKGAKMKHLEADCFEMGSESGKKDEMPVHKVCLDSFAMDQYEVSQERFQKVMGLSPSFFGGCKDCPVESITWKQASAYCSKLGKRLPTEAEWEYAARAGSSSKWGCGIMSTCLSGVAWYSGNSDKHTHPVGTRSSNSWDIYDMQGNVAEWTSDWYGHTYYAFSPKDNPKGANGGDSHSVRGGSYEDADKYMLPSVRGGFDPAFRETTIGFRCAMDLN